MMRKLNIYIEPPVDWTKVCAIGLVTFLGAWFGAAILGAA